MQTRGRPCSVRASAIASATPRPCEDAPVRVGSASVCVQSVRWIVPGGAPETAASISHTLSASRRRSISGAAPPSCSSMWMSGRHVAAQTLRHQAANAVIAAIGIADADDEAAGVAESASPSPCGRGLGGGVRLRRRLRPLPPPPPTRGGGALSVTPAPRPASENASRTKCTGRDSVSPARTNAPAARPADPASAGRNRSRSASMLGWFCDVGGTIFASSTLPSVSSR